MLETGALPAMLRAELSSHDGTPIEYGFALLQPEGVARVVDQGGDDFTLEWKYCGGHGKAICEGARQSSIRVLWEPSTFPELMPQSKADAQAAADPATVAKETPMERRTRWLDMFEAEKKLGERGALQRLAHREGIDRSNMGKAIKKAKKERDTQSRAGEWASQLVQDGKRQG